MSDQYQMVLQWREEDQLSFDILVQIEDALVVGLGHMGDVDGHDLGQNESNIFIMTCEPISCFQRCLLVLDGLGYEQGLAVGFRGEDDETYVSLWPEGTVNFCVS